ncbi:MAG: type I-E CRISPR-associated protein Cse1/CasA [Chloroflexota bacterium]|nr:type I-E CRISPR-associated protein Cse1/CasA [Chloroflexota bacterium]
MFSFNLIDEGWIPCVMPNGKTCEKSIGEVLLQPRDVKEIFDASPLVTVAVHRLLLAVIHRSFERGYGPVSETEWATLWGEGHGSWGTDRLSAYLDKWRSRFDIFHDEHPFFQCRQMPISTIGTKGREKSYAKSIANMVHELAKGNNATLFDHTSESNPQAVTPAEAARLLVAFQAFAVGGLLTYEAGQDPKHFKSADNAPLVKGAVALMEGQNLFQTLMLNLHKYNLADEEPFAMEKDDAPCWERDEETLATDRQPKGYLDLLTWQSRRIRLIPQKDDNGDTVVKQVVIMKGYQFPDGYSLSKREPMLAFRKIRNPGKGQEPWLPMAFQEERALWRDSLALLQSIQEERARPKMLSWLADLSANGLLHQSATYHVAMSGLTTDRANISMWRHERLPLTLKYLEGERLIAKLKEALDLAEGVGRLLGPGFVEVQGETKKPKVPSPMWTLAQEVLPKDQKGKVDPNAVRALVDSLSPTRSYWASLGISFNHLVTALPDDESPDGEYGASVLPWWADEVRKAARRAFREAIDSLDHNGRWLRGITVAEDSFGRLLNTAIKIFLAPYQQETEERGGET